MAKRKRMRLPNGFGQISEIKGQNLRKPFRAMVTVGTNEFGRPICKTLKPQAYFATYNEAYEALIEYHRDPHEKLCDMTMQELFEQWSEWYFKRLKPRSADNIRLFWKYVHSIYNMRVIDVRPKHIRTCIDKASREENGEIIVATPKMKARIKHVFNMMLDYAVEYDIVERNCARDMKLPTVEKTRVETPHIPFTDEEIDRLWKNTDIPFVKIMLIHCYSGWRPLEMCRLTLENTNISEGYFQGGMKTDAGKERIVPIHPRIKPFVEEFYNTAQEINSNSLFNLKKINSTRYSTLDSYSSYRYFFNRVIKKLDLNSEHRPHDCRKHFVTMAKRYDVDEYAIKYIVGHRISDLTERVYTEREIGWLIDEMKKIK